jgi:hypothetical protein
VPEQDTQATFTAEKESPVAVLLPTTQIRAEALRSAGITFMQAKMVACIVTTGKMGTGLKTPATAGSPQADRKLAWSSSSRRAQ